MKTKEAGGTGTMQTRPYQLRVESSANTLYNQTVNVEIIRKNFIVTINSFLHNLLLAPFYNDHIFVILFAKDTVVVQGVEFQARINKGGDISVRLGSSYHQKVFIVVL